MKIGHPAAQLAEEITVKDVMDSTMLSWPVKRYDISPTSDGAAAIVLIAAVVARAGRPTISAVHGGEGFGSFGGDVAARGALLRAAAAAARASAASTSGSGPGPAAAMGRGERLVQVEVRDIATEVPRAADADLGVHVGAVDVDLAAVIVNDLTGLAHCFLEHAVGGRVGDHDCRQIGGVLLGLGLEILQINVAVRRRLHHDNVITHHMRRGRIGAMRRGRDQTDVAMALATRGVVGADRQQAGELPLGAGVGLQASRGHACDLFGDRVFDLNSGIDFHEIETTVGIE